MIGVYKKRIKLITPLILILIVGIALPNLLFAARDETVEARGISQTKGKKDLDREQALSEAFRQAVRQAIGVMVESESLVKNQLLVTDQILSRSTGYIKKYSIISESESDGIYTVVIRAVVSEVKLKKSLDSIGLIVHKMGKPKIMILLTENNGDGKSVSTGPSFNWNDGVAETRIHDLMIRKGFEFVDRGAVMAALRNDPVLASQIESSPSLETLSKLAKSGEAEIIFVGTASSKSSTTTIAGTGIYPCQATVSVRALNVDNGEVIGSHTAQAVAPNINTAAGETEALGKASNEVAERLSQQILLNWKGKVEGSHIVRLVVSGLSGYNDLKLFKDILREKIDELDEIWERSFEGGTAKIDLEIASSSRKANIADQCSLMTIKGKQINITSCTPNVVELTIGSPKKGANK